ncbi:alpha-amylase [Flavobacteriaceae bacterium AH-315-B10]|nr:alpha-amylase [Flavobacteriaceae bacterium AH-315-B10]
MKRITVIIFTFLFIFSCAQNNKKETISVNQKTPFVWEGANLYFLLTDRFNNGDQTNDVNFNRTKKAAKLRGFEGGDIKGITQKIKEGYFTNLGINAIWMTPIVEQIHGGTNEGTGTTYGFHGYWTKDWTAIDPNYGTEEDLKILVETAHSKGIRILLDAVINHTGPITEKDPIWPESWVRTEPQCNFQSYKSTITCTLVKNLPDIKTESNEDVELPPQLIEKWKTEGRYEQEVAELDEFFKRTKYPRTPRFYIMKWLTDYITEFGIDGYRVDTVKHVEEYVWQEFKSECDFAFSKWKENNPEKILDNNSFYLTGEVYNYAISNGTYFDFGDKKVNYFDYGFNSLINFEFKSDSRNDYEYVFSKYSKILHNDLKGFGTLNYLSSHDDSNPFDKNRKKPFETATKLLLSPGTSQVYYGDESARSLIIEDTDGDATLRSYMNWEEIETNTETQAVLKHWQKLGQFRAKHPSVGAGIHQIITQKPYVFYRSFTKGNYIDEVVVGLDLPKGKKELNVRVVFKEGEELIDAYSGIEAKVSNGKVIIDSEFEIVLLEIKN